jgi:8-oxo-dGTP pyrophosphatase MutT (NUDIX family)
MRFGFQDKAYLQVGALCWRRQPVLEVLLVTSLRTQRWIIPKGWPHKGLDMARSAATEAREEAGVFGDVAAKPFGHYRYMKKKAVRTLPCVVQVFPLLVKGRSINWPEKGLRTLRWFPAGQAAMRVQEPELRHLLLQFRRKMAGG